MNVLYVLLVNSAFYPLWDVKMCSVSAVRLSNNKWRWWK